MWTSNGHITGKLLETTKWPFCIFDIKCYHMPENSDLKKRCAPPPTAGKEAGPMGNHKRASDMSIISGPLSPHVCPPNCFLLYDASWLWVFTGAGSSSRTAMGTHALLQGLPGPSSPDRMAWLLKSVGLLTLWHSFLLQVQPLFPFIISPRCSFNPWSFCCDFLYFYMQPLGRVLFSPSHLFLLLQTLFSLLNFALLLLPPPPPPLSLFYF